MALVDVNINPQLRGVISSADEKRQLLESLRLARYGNDSERAEYSYRWQNGGALPYLWELLSEEYVNAIWFVYHYWSNRMTSGKEEFLTKYANIDNMHDRTNGTLTISDLATASTSHSGSSSSHSGSSSSHSGSSRSGSSSRHSSSSGGGTVIITDENTGETVITTQSAINQNKNFGGNPYAVVRTHGGVTGYKATEQDPSAGSWSFSFRNGETFTTSDYNEALLVEAALWQVGNGPRPGFQSWTIGGQTYYDYSSAWDGYQNELSATLQSLANGSAASQYSEAQNANMNQEAVWALNNQQNGSGSSGSSVSTTPYKVSSVASAKKSSNLKWWIIGGAVVLLIGGVIYRVYKNKK